MMTPIISIVGKSKEGKTHLMEKLISELSSRGYKVATVKHHIHNDFQIDREGKSTFRHAQAGAKEVSISSPTKFALIRKVDRELTLDEIIERYFPEADIILTEGYRKEDKPKIEVIDSMVSTTPLCQLDELVLIVSDTEIDTDVPQFRWNEVKAMVDLLEGEGFCHGSDNKEAPA